MYRKSAALLLPFLVAACASTQDTASTGGVPAKLKAGPDEALAMIVPANGVQIYECREKKDQPGTFDWEFVAPAAALYDKAGNKIGTHYAGPHWEAADGSKIVGTVKERADAPRSDAIPWLLLTTKSVGPDGAFSKITSIQRINTSGGVAPKSGCVKETVGSSARIHYTADYYFLARK